MTKNVACLTHALLPCLTLLTAACTAGEADVNTPLPADGFTQTAPDGGSLFYPDTGLRPDVGALTDPDTGTGLQPDSATPAGDTGAPNGDGGTPAVDSGAAFLPLTESLTAYGRYWNFDVASDYKPWPDNGSDLTSVPRFVNGPCKGWGTGQCAFQTRTFAIFDGHLVESISAYGKYYNFDATDGYKAWPDNGSDLTTVPRYAAGPCKGRAAGQCVFDTRTFVTLAGKLTESITAHGKAYNFDASPGAGYKPWPDNGRDLTGVPRFAAGPCKGRSAGQCVFETRTFGTFDGHLVESITAYGKYYNFDADDGYKPWPDNGSEATGVARFGGGPCAGQSAASCGFGTRTIVDLAPTLP